MLALGYNEYGRLIRISRDGSLLIRLLQSLKAVIWVVL